MAAEETSAAAAAQKAPPRKVGVSGSVWGLKIAAMVFLLLSFLVYIAILRDPEASTAMIGVAILAVGLVIGIVGIFIGNIKFIKRMEYFTLNLFLLGISLVFLVIGAILSGISIDTGHTIPWTQIFGVLLYGFFTLGYFELAHASFRFTDIDDYARSHELKGFNITTVISNYFMWFFALMAIVFALSLMILSTHRGLILMISATNEVFGASVELNSIYVFAISLAIWFVPLGIFAAIIFGEGSLIKSTKTILIKAEKAPGEELMGLQTLEKPEDLAQR